jgi:CheY-like chemotaxis protein
MSQKRILLVEDDPNSQVLASTVLEYFGISVDIARSAEEGLVYLEQQRYSAVLIDLALPGMDGWGLLKTIRNNAHTKNLPCIAMTAYHDAMVAHKAIQSGFRAFFPKPIQVETFAQDLQHYM